MIGIEFNIRFENNKGFITDENSLDLNQLGL